MKGKTFTKTETIQEFLARGGKITVVPQGVGKEVKEQVRQMTGGPAVILTMDEGHLYYGEKEKAKAKPKGPEIDINALPEALRRKFLERLNAQTKEEQEYIGSDDEDEEDEYES